MTLEIIIIAIVIVGIMDLISTSIGLKLGLRETNPIMRFFQKILGKFWILAKLILHGVAIVAVIMYPVNLVFTIAGIAVAINLLVVYNNYKAIRKYRG